MFVSRSLGLIWIFAFCVIGLGGCEFVPPFFEQIIDDEEQNPWVGTWSLESIDGERLTDLFAEEEAGEIYGYSDWTFYEDGTWEAGFEFGFEFQNGIEVGGSLWFWLEGTYALDGERYVLAIETDTPEPLFDDSNQTTGTWHIEDDTLTLYDDEGSVIVFYRYPVTVLQGTTKGSYPDDSDGTDAVVPPE